MISWISSIFSIAVASSNHVLQAALNHPRQAADPFLDQLFRSERKAQPQCNTPTTLGKEGGAGYEGYPLADSFGKQLVTVHRFGKA
jgi:hypothetical protein